MRLGVGASLLWALACDDGALVLDGPPPGWGDDGRPESLPGGIDVPGGTAPPAPSLPPEQYGDDASWVFDEDAIREYQLTLEPGEWEALKASALAEEYFPARLSIDGAAFGVVGLRFKGNRGTLARCADSRGNLRCRKLSMKLKFDEYVGDQRFFGLKRLNLNSMLSDATAMHERLAYQLFREMGVTAPRAVHARLSVNGEALGVFTVVEQIDGRFTDDRFAGGDGNLYKEQWPITGSTSALDATLKTNEDAPDHNPLIQFHSELAAAASGAASETTLDVVARHMDVDQLLAFVAVDRIITNWDGPTSFYCRGRGCYNHNYYLYQHEGESRFSVIPWDLDNTFRLWAPFDPVPMPLVLPDTCSTRYPIFGSVQAKAPACDALFGALAQVDRDRYRSTLQRLLAGPFDLARLDAWIDARLQQLSPHVASDPNGPTLAYFQVAVQQLRRDLRYLVERTLAEQDGVPVQRDRLSLDGMNDFESATPLGVQLAVGPHWAGGSQVMAELVEGDALDGQKHVEVSFTFPASTEEERWVRMRLLMGDVMSDWVDLNTKARVRLELESDAPRTVRIGIDSLLYSQVESRAFFGWDVTLDGSHQIIELDFADARYPEWGVDAITLADTLSQATALLIEPRVDERKDRGLGSADATDHGRIRIDRIVFTP